MGKNRAGFFVMLAGKRATFNWLFFIFVGIFGRGGYINVLTGMLFILAGAFMRTLAAGTIKKNEVLTDTGPYSMCRNPLYLGSFLISAGLVIAAKNTFILLYFLVFFPLAYIPAILTEEDFLAGKFGENYLLYKKKTPAFIPHIKKTDMENFSWKQVRENKEYINWLVILTLLLVLSIKPYLIFKK